MWGDVRWLGKDMQKVFPFSRLFTSVSPTFYFRFPDFLLPFSRLLLQFSHFSFFWLFSATNFFSSSFSRLFTHIYIFPYSAPPPNGLAILILMQRQVQSLVGAYPKADLLPQVSCSVAHSGGKRTELTCPNVNDYFHNLLYPTLSIHHPFLHVNLRSCKLQGD